ncbi:MAG: hypothetical protein K8F30_08340, partial [Taibaiella sp.]|nr:hypothetical protein [Taibaiella sp.]
MKNLINVILLLIMQTIGAVIGYAQNVQGSGQTSNTLSVNATCNTTNTLSSLNIDMFEMNSNSTNQTPACNWGNGNDDYFWAAGFSGATCSGTYAGITVGASGSIGLGGAQKFQALPYSLSTQAGDPVNDVDVAVGLCQDRYASAPQYFVMAVYESNNEIFLEWYYIYIDWGAGDFEVGVHGLYTTPPSGPTTFNPHTSNPQRLSNSNGTARYPHIDLIYDDTYPAAGGRHEAIGYVVSWQEGMPGSEEVWGAEGAISANGVYNPPPASHVFYINDGKQPDVTGVTAANTAGSSDPSKAYITYLTRNGDEVLLADWDYGSATPPSNPSPNLHGAISATAGTDDFLYPRIAGPQYYDFTSPLTDDPACVVVVTEDDGSSGYY